MTLEREAKLIAPSDLQLPDLTGLARGSQAAALPDRRLDAVYYDTADLRLARSGISVRFRQGEPGHPWTVKLPQRSNGSVLVRREIEFDGPPDEVPAPAIDLLLATTRGASMDPVATVSSVRHPVEIRDASGDPLAELVDDEVSTTRDGEAPVSFREIEIEARGDGKSARRVLANAVAAFEELGCTAEAVPKVVRALGAAALAPPDVVVPSLPDRPTMVDTVRHALARSVAQMIDHDPGARLGDDPEDVHQLRVATRRLRSDLRSFRTLLHDDVGAVRDEIRWVGAEVGAVRDADVLGARFGRSIATLPDVDAAGAKLLVRRLEDQARTAREQMLGALRTERYTTVLDSLVGVAADPPWREEGELAATAPPKLAARLVRREWRHLHAAVAALASPPSDAELHRVRILAKRCRYAAEAVAPIIGKKASRFADAVADVQTVLGDHQDTVVAEAWLREAAAALPKARVAAGELIAYERHERARLREEWPDAWKQANAEKIRHWLV